MQFKKPLDPSEQYSLDDFGRICPAYQMGWSKVPWKDSATFDDAINAIAESRAFQEDAFPPDDLQINPEEWSDLRAKGYLDIEEGFFLATGVNVSGAVFRFQWGEEVFFNMRPDFGFLSLATHFGEQPINAAESKIRDMLIDYYREPVALQRAIEVGELEPLKLYSVGWWREFWKSRGIPILDETDEKKVDRPIAAKERNTLLVIIAALAKEAKIDLSKPSKAGEQIANLTEFMGASVDHATIEQKIKQIPNALESRAK